MLPDINNKDSRHRVVEITLGNGTLQWILEDRYMDGSWHSVSLPPFYLSEFSDKFLFDKCVKEYFDKIKKSARILAEYDEHGNPL